MKEISRRDLIRSAAGLAAAAPLARLTVTDLIGVEHPAYDSETADSLSLAMNGGDMFAVVRGEGGDGGLRQLTRGRSDTFKLPGRSLGLVPTGIGRVAMSRSGASTFLAIAEERTVHTYTVSYELNSEDEALPIPWVSRPRRSMGACSLRWGRLGRIPRRMPGTWCSSSRRS